MLTDKLKIWTSFIKNRFQNSKIIFITEQADWVIKDICTSVSEKLNSAFPALHTQVTYTAQGAKNKLLHFGSINTLFKKNQLSFPHPSNKIIITWFHILDNDWRIKFIPELNKRVIAVHTACTITKEKLIRYGFDAEKIVLIPLGLDLNTFKPCSSEQKQMLKEKLRLPKDKLIIGSFQKDGQGWGEGNDPKLEKGPDVFCDTVEQIAHKYPVHVLLTGPARGYVKKRLQDAGISFTHDYLKEYKNIIEYYQALDLYIVSSREEGGPMAILECMASGIPFVTTPVGMVPDIIKDRYNGLVTTSVNSAELAQKACELVESSNLKEQIIQNGLIVVKDYDWDKISQRYYNALYSKLLS